MSFEEKLEQTIQTDEDKETCMSEIKNESEIFSSVPKYVIFDEKSEDINTDEDFVSFAGEPLETIGCSYKKENLNRTGAANNDEELTPLTWLHDKDLLKSIVNSNVILTAAPLQITNDSAQSPTSDFLEDSSASVDNTSSVNSSTDQGISLKSFEISQSVTQDNKFTYCNMLSQREPLLETLSKADHDNVLTADSLGLSSKTIRYASPINNNTTEKNFNLLLPSASVSILPKFGAKHLLHNFEDKIVSSELFMRTQSPTTTIHTGPSGTTTVVEYNASSNFISSQHFTKSTYLCETRSESSMDCISDMKRKSSYEQTTHQHFRKKYLREKMNASYADCSKEDNDSSGIDAEETLTLTLSKERCIAEESESLVDINVTCDPGSRTSYDDLGEDVINSFDVRENYDANGSNSTSEKLNQKPEESPKQKHPSNLPFDPLLHTTNKPPYSFSSLIFMAIEDSAEKALPVKEIYAWIVQHFPYFRTAPTGWKNSVRHNLSLNKSFLKVEKAPNMGKGSLWRVEQQQRPSLIQALNRSPFFSCSAFEKLSTPKLSVPVISAEGSPNTHIRSHLDARIFPKLSKMIAGIVNLETKNTENHKLPCPFDSSSTSFSTTKIENLIHRDHNESSALGCGTDNIDDIYAATAMLALKHGPKVFAEPFQNGIPIITSSPSEDHTYSAGRNSTNSAANSKSYCRIESSVGTIKFPVATINGESDHIECSPEEIEERRRHAEGVDALLSFASEISSAPYLSPVSPIIQHETTAFESVSQNEAISTDDVVREKIASKNYAHRDIKGCNARSNATSSSIKKPRVSTSNFRSKLKRKAAWIR